MTTVRKLVQGKATARRGLGALLGLTALLGTACTESEARSVDEFVRAELEGYSGPFTIAAHIAEDRHTVLGLYLDTGAAIDVTEASAQAAAELASEPGQGLGGLGLRAGQWLFSGGSGDWSWFTAVSERTGHVVLQAEVAWVGMGDASFPLRQLPADNLGTECPSQEPFGVVEYVDLDVYPWGTAIPEEDRNEALQSLEQTALLCAIQNHGEVTQTLVVAIPSYQTSSAPREYQWVVLMSAVAPGQGAE